jgi:tetratricopeptide (TPR) repeat protein
VSGVDADGVRVLSAEEKVKARKSKAGARAHFDVTALRKLAGAKVFERGQDYHADGQVEILSLEPVRVLAQVAGSDDYRTVLTGRGKKIGGECSCPAFTDWGFCKHMVATALAANEALDSAAAGNGAALDGAGALGRIRAHLKSKDADALVDMIVDLAERDPALFRKLALAAAIVQGDDKAVEKRLRRAIDGATRTRSFVDYGAAAGWADEVATALDAVDGLATGERADVALRLSEHAIDRIERAIESIDDSDGHCGALLEQARDIHLAACRVARPDPVALARDLFNRETDNDYDTFYGAAAVYDEVLGEAGLAEYRRLAREAWEKLPPADRSRLEGILDFFAEREGNVEERITLRANDLDSPWSYLRLAEFCLQQDRKDEALRRAEEGLWRFEDGRPDERLTLFAAGLLTKAGRKGDAEKHLWRAFERAPSRELYDRLRKLGGAVAGDRARAILDASLSADRGIAGYGAFDLLVRLLIKEKMLHAAWSALERRGGGGAELRQALADASKTSHPVKALAVYGKLVEDHAQFGRYEEAIHLVKRMASLRDAAEQATYVADLKERHKRKRNFMKLL